MSAHTTGRLKVRENGDANSYAVLDEQGNWLLSLLHNGQQLTDTQRENLRRLVACWNACEGIDTVLLESLRYPLAQLQRREVSMAAERHELLAELKNLVSAASKLTKWEDPTHDGMYQAMLDAQRLLDGLGNGGRRG